MTQGAILKTIPLDFQWQTADPFLFCVHHHDAYPQGNEQMAPPSESLVGRNIGSDFDSKDGWSMYHGDTVPGFPVHPHRGFETVTVVQDGIVDHSDSMGAAGRYGAGDTQWMTAGKGVQHSEMFPLIHSDKANTMQLFQIWINLPQKSKFVDPHFVMLWGEKTPRKVYQDESGNKTQVEVVAGALDDMTPLSPPPESWAADPANEVGIWIIDMEPHARWTLPAASEGVNRMLYFFEGDSLSVDETALKVKTGAALQPDVSVSLQAGDQAARILVLQGKPINEPVVQYGPFVMNTAEEIQQAFRDYQRTQFGGWPWAQMDQVHPRDQGRFARFADGREESP
ncbi:MAG: pirin family protein [Gammaproteobacteria bacterium]|nr:pirin family protein [Gammaproteobacteria bacterium]